MPCNDPGVYIDRMNNALRGLGYEDSDERPHGVPATYIYPADERRYKAKTNTPEKRLDFLTSKMCKLLTFIRDNENKNFSCEYLKEKFVTYDLDLFLWDEEHAKFDQQKKARKTKTKVI